MSTKKKQAALPRRKLGLQDWLTIGIFVAIGLVALTLLLAPKEARAASTEVTVHKLTRTGVTYTASTVDVSNGNKFKLLTDGVLLQFTNSGATNTTVTATDQFTNPQGYTYDAVFYVASGKTITVGPWLRSRWASSTGYLEVDYAGDTNCTVRALRLPIGEPDSQTK